MGAAKTTEVECDAAALRLVKDFNERFRQRGDVWGSLGLDGNVLASPEKKKKFDDFRKTVYESLKYVIPFEDEIESKYCTPYQRTTVINFLINLFQSLEVEAARKICFSLCNVSLWRVLSERQRNQILQIELPSMVQMWKEYNSSQKKKKKKKSTLR
eukprot:Trichotokara_eunicae@DN7717_c0_g1_i1.p1